MAAQGPHVGWMVQTVLPAAEKRRWPGPQHRLMGIAGSLDSRIRLDLGSCPPRGFAVVAPSPSHVGTGAEVARPHHPLQ